jgi:CheY-like chemotaxis protein
MTAPPTGNEAERLQALSDYGVLDTLPEQAYDDIAGLAALICNAPIALVSLVDDRRQWFKARFGLSAPETPRELAFCAHTIQQGDLLVVPDAAADPRFASNPLVTGDPHIRFYAGVPLTTPDGFNLGTLCVLDRSPRTLTALQREALRALARQAMAQLELRRQVFALAVARAELRVLRRLVFALAVARAELRSSEQRVAEAAAGPEAPPPAGGETVLLVDDEEVVRALARQLLRGAGYTVLEADSAAAALGAAAGREGRIDLLLTDVMMPGMTGTELADRMRSASPGLRVLFISGHVESLPARGEGDGREEHLLRKPFSIEAFLRKVREALDAEP